MSAEKLRELKTLASVCPELNMANYTEDDVRHLNDWAIEMSLLVEQYALSQQPATGEPVAWIRRHPNGALSNELLTHVQVEQVRRDSGAWVPLYTHPAPSVPDGWVLMPRELTPDEAMRGQGALLDMCWDATTCFVARYAELIRATEPRRAAAHAAHPAQSVPADVAQDAERYRWLRDLDHWPAPFSSIQEPEPVRGRDLDEAIDAAMLAA